MIVHEDTSNSPTVGPIVKMSEHENKKFLIVNNHVREIPIQYKGNSTHSDTDEYCERSKVKNFEKKIYKNIKKKTKSKNKDTTNDHSKICENDLEELRTVYRNCKAVIEKIEMKYSHLLDLDGEADFSKRHKRKHDKDFKECQCEKNKKILFDDDGTQITVDTSIENHICSKKPKEDHKHKNIEIQYKEDDAQLPDDLQELLKLSQNPNLEQTFRNQVVYKIKAVKSEALNEIKFNKHSLIVKLKSDPDELLAFEGTNLASLPGYP